MTPAIKYLEHNNVSFELLSYQHGSAGSAFGTEAAEKLHLPMEQVFKTLVAVLNTEKLVTAMVPVSATLDMKAVAQCMRVKSAKMAMPQQVTNSTGYVLGGVSPFGQKRRLPTLVDISALQFNKIYVSAGKRGLELVIAPNILSERLDAQFLSISKHH